MAWTVIDLPAQEIADAAGDLPLMIAQHCLAAAKDTPAFRAHWRSTLTLATGVDRTDPQALAARAWDRFLGRPTRPAGSETSWAFCVDLGAIPATFDHVVVPGHNFGTIGGLTVVFQIADNEAYTTNLQTIATWTPGASNARLVSLSLGHGADPAPNVYQAVQYARLLITKDGLTQFTPEFGELIFGRRRQLRRRPLLSYDPDQQRSEVGDFVARSGRTTRYVFNRGQAKLEASIAAVDTAEHAVVTGWWSDTNQGTRVFGWVERPNSAPNSVLWMLAQPVSVFPFTTDKNRWFTFDMTEQPPFLSMEVTAVVQPTAMSWAPEYPDFAGRFRRKAMTPALAGGDESSPVANFPEDDRLAPEYMSNTLFPVPVGGRWKRRPCHLFFGKYSTSPGSVTGRAIW